MPYTGQSLKGLLEYKKAQGLSLGTPRGMTSYGIDPALSWINPNPAWAKKKKAGGIETFPIGDELTGFESMIPGQAAVSGDLSTALVNALKGQFPEEYFSTAIAGPLRRAFETETRPAIAEEFVGPGTYWGTARAGEVVKGRTRMEEDITAKRAELAYQTQLQALQAALAYLGIPLMAAYQPYDEGGGAGTKKWATGWESGGHAPGLASALVNFKQAAGNKPQATAAPEWDPNSLVSKLAYWDYYNIPEEKRYPTIGEAIARMMSAGVVEPPILGGPTYQASQKGVK